MEQSLIVPDDVRAAMSTAGWDMDKELDDQSKESSGFELPRIRIEHKDNGKHRMYIDTGESYLDDDSQEISIKGNKLSGIVFAEQSIKALWEEGAEVPKCSAIDNIPMGQEPLADSCKHCEYGVIGGVCKPKIRLFMLAEIDGQVKPLVFALSPTSIKHWNAHKKKLHRSNLPIVAVNTTFELMDVKKGTYRWAEVKAGVDGIVSKELLLLTKQARDQFEEITKVITERDYSEPGDVNSVEPF
ncbi:MAG: hypothetical protein H8E18_15935 [FCB group bacterium]|nr:hypothetical protein [FCB group bacterium]